MPPTAALKHRQARHVHDPTGARRCAHTLSLSRSSLPSRSLQFLRLSSMPLPFRPLRTASWYREQYAAHGTRSIAKMIGCSASKVVKDLRHHGIEVEPQTRWTELKRDYFDEIDNANKAYLFGLIAADGTVSRATAQLRIRLAQQDRDFLETIRCELGAAPLRTERQPHNRQPSAVLCVSAKQVVDSLIRLGITENKDNVLGPVVEIAAPLDRHFVRGLVDGDGTLKFPKRHYPRIEFKNRNPHLRAAVRAYWESLGARVAEYSWQGKYPAIYCNSADSVLVSRALYLADAPLALQRKVERARRFQTFQPRKTFG